MPTTLARRLRRIGLLPTTHKTVKEQVLVKNEAGEEEAETRNKKVLVRHHERLSEDTRRAIADRIRADVRAKRKGLNTA